MRRHSCKLVARQVLEGADLASGNQTTLDALRDEIRRPGNPRELVPPELTNFVPLRVRNLCSSRRGAAAGPSGMTMEHLRPLLDDARSLHSFFLVAEQFARAQVRVCHDHEGWLCECIAHALQGPTELDPEATITSIDGVGVFDLFAEPCWKASHERRSCSVRQVIPWTKI